MSSHIWPSPAKINRFLHVMEKRHDGYHNLETLFQFLDYCDEMSFKVTKDNRILRKYDYGFDYDSDLCVRAAKKIQAISGVELGVEITLNKKIPMGAGLGGGSSNAATTLLALNQLWQCGYTRDELSSIALELGADVPVFVNGFAAFAQGVGEILSPVILPETLFLVVVPNINVSTKQVFCHKQLTCRPQMTKIRALENCIAVDFGENQLEPVVRAEYPQVDVILKWLNQYGQARMSGSGGAVFIPIKNQEQGQVMIAEKPVNTFAFVARGLNWNPVNDMIATT